MKHFKNSMYVLKKKYYPQVLAICYHLRTTQKKKNSDLNKKGKVIKYELFCDWVIARPEICKIMGGIEGALFGLAGRRFRHVSYNPNPN